MMLVLGLGLGLAESPCKCQFWVLKCIFFVCNLYLFTIHSFRDYIFSLTYLLLLVATDSIFFYMLQSTQNKITQVLDKSSDVLTADIWTDRRMHSFWGVTVHGIVCSANCETLRVDTETTTLVWGSLTPTMTRTVGLFVKEHYRNTECIDYSLNACNICTEMVRYTSTLQHSLYID